MTTLYQVSASFPSLEQFGPRSQIRQAAMSLHLNIIAGTKAGSDVECRHFLNNALRSTHEVTITLDTAQQLGRCEMEETQTLHEEMDENASMIIRLPHSRN